MKGSVENSDFCTSDALHMHQRTDAPHHLPQKDKDMTTIKRFVLDHERNVIDTLNPTGPTGLLFDDEPEDEIYLREKILRECLFEPVDDLIINVQPEKTDSWGEPYNEEAHAIRRAILNAIRASQLNTLEPALSINNRFDGTLKRKKVGLQDVTSLSLFRDDVERILRDLYGDIDSEALERALRAQCLLSLRNSQDLCAGISGRNIKMQWSEITYGAASGCLTGTVFLVAITEARTKHISTFNNALAPCVQTHPPTAGTL